jgi:hypothetical protein
MTSTNKRAGNFRELKAHLPLFDEALHRHDRGWPHSPPEPGAQDVRRRPWKTVGIFHFRHEEEDQDGEPGNASSG